MKFDNYMLSNLLPRRKSVLREHVLACRHLKSLLAVDLTSDRSIRTKLKKAGKKSKGF